MSIDGNGTMHDIIALSLSIQQPGLPPIQLTLHGSDFLNEKAVIALEMYRKEVWRVAIVARGFDGGLGDLLRAYGGEEEEGASNVLVIPVTLKHLVPPPSDLWYYGKKSMRASSPLPAEQLRELGPATNEPAVMREIIATYRNASQQVNVKFLTTGGVGRTKEITELLVQSRTLPIFWEFIGVGGAGYGVLERVQSITPKASFTHKEEI